MNKVRLTKNGLRDEQQRVAQLQLYLPTLQLKKSLLQYEINQVKVEIEDLQREFKQAQEDVEEISSFLEERFDRGPLYYSRVEFVEKRYENVAGVEIPIFESVIFKEADYFLFDTPLWMEAAVSSLRKMIGLSEKINVSEEKKRALKKEHRDVSIRVNLFEKILIPRCLSNIRKIKIFLGDQELAAVSQAKVAKSKILSKKGRV